MKDEVFSSFISSFFLHVLFGVATCTSLISFKVPKNDGIEIEFASIGDFDKEIGGTGQGELETPQPMESTKEVLKESEILPEDKIEPVPEETPPPAKEPEPVPPAPDPEPLVKEGSITPGETIPIKEEPKKIEKKEVKKKTDKVDRPPKRKRNTIVDLIAKKKKVNAAFDDLLSSLDKDDALNIKKRKHGASSKLKGEGGGGGGTALSSGDYDMIKKQVIPYWIVPTGMQNYEQYVVRLKISVRDDGSITNSDISIDDNVRYNTDKMYRIAVDSAKRALLQASPLKFPKEKIRNLKNFLIVFDPRDAI